MMNEVGFAKFISLKGNIPLSPEGAVICLRSSLDCFPQEEEDKRHHHSSEVKDDHASGLGKR
jgi:hypothetical protein